MMLFNPCNSISKADLVLLAVCYFYLPYTIWGQFILEYLLSIACLETYHSYYLFSPLG